MITETESLLRKRPDILAGVLAEIDCVVIDEFQDTNPVQFALLWRLARGVGRALIVGDTKQAIMGFQGADPRLAAALQDAHSGCVDRLTRNWRSVPRIMEVVNAIGPRLFPEGYDPLTATREDTGTPALEAIFLPRSWTDKKNHTADCVAQRVVTILSDDTYVFDKSKGQMRPAKPSDVAVLCYTASQCADMAAAIRARGLPVRIQADGWLTAPATGAARAALAYASDPGDTHAALRFLTLGPPHLNLQDALSRAVEKTLTADPALEPLRALHEQAERLPVAELVSRIIDAAGLRDWAARSSDLAQAMADLARLQSEALTFDELAVDLKAAAGFHGGGPQIFLAWLQAQTDKTWGRHPDAAGWSAPGVEISTWHAAKGREWPITAVSGFDFKFPERPNTMRAEFVHFDDLDNVLEQAGLRWLPDFAAPEKQKIFADALIDADERDAARELYVVLTRARDRLILALPDEPSTEKDRPERMVDLLRDRVGLRMVEGGMAVSFCDQEFATSCFIEQRDREFSLAEPSTGELFPHFGESRGHVEAPRTPWHRSPSTLVPSGEAVLPSLTHGQLSAKVGGLPDDFSQATDRGSAWHLAFRVASERPDLHERIAKATRLDGATIDAIAQQARSVRDWLREQGYHQLHFELPLQSVAPDGSETNAVIDCLAEREDGFLILDHKSGACPHPEERFASYLPQLQSYAQLVAEFRPDKPVTAIAINWMNEGFEFPWPLLQFLLNNKRSAGLTSFPRMGSIFDQADRVPFADRREEERSGICRRTGSAPVLPHCQESSIELESRML